MFSSKGRLSTEITKSSSKSNGMSISYKSLQLINLIMLALQSVAIIHSLTIVNADMSKLKILSI